MGGTTATTFSPDEVMTRAMLVTVLYRLAGSPAVSGTDTFADTAIDGWYSDAVLWAYQEGIVSGYENGLFGTNDPVSREQFATIFWKYALVYLPYGFNAADTQTRYNVLYLLHGGGGSTRSYFGGEDQSNNFKCILDNLIQNGELEPMLIVTPSFYPTESTDSSISTAADAVKQFPKELVNDLIPAVEGTYPTYAETTDTTGLQSSRDHRGFGGFSMGSVATWYVFTDCLDYFRYYLPCGIVRPVPTVCTGRTGSKSVRKQPGIRRPDGCDDWCTPLCLRRWNHTLASSVVDRRDELRQRGSFYDYRPRYKDHELGGGKDRFGCKAICALLGVYGCVCSADRLGG